jgi:hypothetical protein
MRASGEVAAGEKFDRVDLGSFPSGTERVGVGSSG